MTRENVEIYFDARIDGLYAPDTEAPHPLELELPKKRDKVRKSNVIHYLDKALKLSSRDHLHKKRALNQAHLATIKAGFPPNTQAESRLRKLARRYPDGPWRDFFAKDEPQYLVVPTTLIPLEIFSAKFEYYPNFTQEPFFAGLFENFGEKLTTLAIMVTGQSYTQSDLTLLYPAKDLTFQTLSRWSSVPPSQFTYKEYLSYYHTHHKDFSRKLVYTHTIPIARVDLHGESILDLWLSPPAEVSAELICNLQQRRRRGNVKLTAIDLVHGGKLQISSKPQISKEGFIEVLNMIKSSSP